MSFGLPMVQMLFLAFSWFLHGADAGACYHCVSQDRHLEPVLRRQLKTQADVFFWQIGTQWDACTRTVDPDNPSIQAQICSKYDLCVTLQPNVNGSTFVVRGCLENVLRHNWREDPRLHAEGCYMVRSLPSFPNKNVLDYVICVCKGDYCNNEHSLAFVDGFIDFPTRDSILHLAPIEERTAEQQPLKYVVTSPGSLVKMSVIILPVILFFR